MKQIKDFLKDTNCEIIKSTLLSRINGGLMDPKTSSWTETNSSGCTLYVTDSYNDTNNNNTRDCDEPGTLYTTQDCSMVTPPCPEV